MIQHMEAALKNNAIIRVKCKQMYSGMIFVITGEVVEGEVEKIEAMQLACEAVQSQQGA